MEIKVYAIKVDVPKRLKNLFIRFGIPALIFVGMVSTVRADAVTVPNAFSDGDVLSAAALNENFTTLATGINQAAPVGAISAYYGIIPPEGWLIADGTVVSKITNPAYADLVDHLRGLNDAQGATNLTDTNQAKLPDLRGQFLRGQDRDAGVNPDAGEDSIGQAQEDAYQSHWHEVKYHNGPGSSEHFTWGSGTSGQGPYEYNGGAVTNFAAQTSVADAEDNTPRTSNETRPKSVTVLYIIKY